MGEFVRYNPWTLFREPRPRALPPEIDQQLRVEFAQQGPRNVPAEADIAERLYKNNLQGRPYKSAIQEFLDIAKRLSDMQLPYQRNNKEHSVPVMNSVIAHLSENLALHKASDIPDDFMTKLTEQVDILETARGNSVNWYYPKLFGVKEKVLSWKFKYWWVDQVKSRLSDSLDGLSIEEMQQASDDLWQKLGVDRGYGIKTCFYTSPLFLPSDMVLYITDNKIFQDIAKNYPSNFSSPVVANIGIGEKATPKTELKPEKKSGLLTKEGVQFTGFTTNINASFVPVFSDGTMGVGYDNSIPLQKGFAEKDAQAEYELWRLFTYMRLHDVTRRADIVDRLPSLDQAETSLMKQLQEARSGQAKRPTIRYRELLVPRLKSADTQTSDAPEEKRFVDRHHVGWFVRRLPVGYHATERAKEYAKQNGVTLQDGETIVQEHERGSRKEGQATPDPVRKVIYRKK